MKAYSGWSLSLAAVCLLQVLATVQSGSCDTTFQCRLCNRAYTLSECSTNVTCDASTEDCYMDELITDQLTVVYMGGCRSKQVCVSHRGRRRERRGDLVACSRCCNAQSDCNIDQCGIKQIATVTTPKPTLLCRSCNKASTLADCNQAHCDATTEECFLDELITDQLTIVYDGGCRSKQVCNSGGKRKRGILFACSRCCNNEDDCNARLCGIQNATVTTPQPTSSPLLCRSCNKASTLADCNQAHCDATTEDCYMEELITDQLTIVYDGGCRSKQVCNSGGKRKRGILLTCSRCCSNEDDCNARLCGIQNATVTTPQPTSSPLLCRSCNMASTLADCNQAHCDATSEECYMDELLTNQLTVVYNAGCRNKQVCSGGAIIGKRKRGDLVACSRCCSSKNYCNSALCGIKPGRKRFALL